MGEQDIKNSPFKYGTHVNGLSSAKWEYDHNATFDEVYKLIIAALSEKKDNTLSKHKLDVHEDFIWFSVGEKSTKYPDTRYVNIIQIVNLYDYPEILFILSKKGRGKWYMLLQFKSTKEARALADLISNKNNEVSFDSENISRKSQLNANEDKNTSMNYKENALLHKGTNAEVLKTGHSSSSSMSGKQKEKRRSNESKSLGNKTEKSVKNSQSDKNIEVNFNSGNTSQKRVPIANKDNETSMDHKENVLLHQSTNTDVQKIEHSSPSSSSSSSTAKQKRQKHSQNESKLLEQKPEKAVKKPQSDVRNEKTASSRPKNEHEKKKHTQKRSESNRRTTNINSQKNGKGNVGTNVTNSKVSKPVDQSRIISSKGSSSKPEKTKSKNTQNASKECNSVNSYFCYESGSSSTSSASSEYEIIFRVRAR